MMFLHLDNYEVDTEDEYNLSGILIRHVTCGAERRTWLDSLADIVQYCAEHEAQCTPNVTPWGPPTGERVTTYVNTALHITQVKSKEGKTRDVLIPTRQDRELPTPRIKKAGTW